MMSLLMPSLLAFVAVVPKFGMTLPALGLVLEVSAGVAQSWRRHMVRFGFV